VEGKGLAATEGLEAALPLLRRVETRARELGARPLEWRTALTLADLHRETGRSEGARAAAARALEALEDVARGIDEAPLRASFEASEPMVRARALAQRA